MKHPQEIMPLIKRLKENDIPFTLGGSGMLYSLNLAESVNDWDLMVDCPKSTFIEAIDAYEWVEKESGDLPFASEYRIGIDSLDVDVIGGFAFHVEGKILKLPLSHVPDRTWQGMNISSPELWYVAYHIMGRLEKAELILTYLQTNHEIVDQHLVKNLLENDNLTDEIQRGLNTLIEN
ncbi:hypothetical protein [Paenibacillus silvae]|uniref:Nucleotidyltransferase family protein n=1 Tax=Paenibacillus silvae TaxID=1325358 RepID=A0ABQ1ZDQ6_9BACL|nr:MULTISPECIES: hypothetical protein [Paenibacillus]MCK6073890.1 hypothetical protein [Paenibacillus silvae]MCK6148634.1 hypothetical protein [Paenibacillus silvae]MCK6266934.1 hypothetical protein [Paenibacillus silvae]GGH60369.1 hypothetical protein GCM10008014_34840 [Paenibacillus silvae]